MVRQPANIAACGAGTRLLTIRMRKLLALALVGVVLLAAPGLAPGHCREDDLAHCGLAVPGRCSQVAAPFDACDGETRSDVPNTDCKTCIDCHIDKLAPCPRASGKDDTNSSVPARPHCHAVVRRDAPQLSLPSTGPPNEASLAALRSTILLI